MASSTFVPNASTICWYEVLVDLRRLDLDLLLAGELAQLVLRGAELLDRAVRDVERVEDLGLGDLVRARLDHEDGLVGAGDDEVEVAVALGEVDLARVDDEVALDLADAHRADGRRERDRRDHQRRGGAVHREDVVRVVVVDRQRDADELRLVAPVLGEQRAQRPVDHAGGERALGARAALALEERAGDLARGVHALLDVDREGQEVRVAEVAHGRGAEDHGVALADDDGAGGLLGHLARLEGDLAAGDLDRDGLHGIGIHMRLSFLGRPSDRRPASLLLVSSFRNVGNEDSLPRAVAVSPLRIDFVARAHRPQGKHKRFPRIFSELARQGHDAPCR